MEVVEGKGTWSLLRTLDPYFSVLVFCSSFGSVHVWAGGCSQWLLPRIGRLGQGRIEVNIQFNNKLSMHHSSAMCRYYTYIYIYAHV